MNKHWMALWCMVAASAGAQVVQTPIERPALKPGDRWVYRTVDQWVDKETGRQEVVFVSEADGLLTFRQQPLVPAGEAVMLRANADLMPCRSMRGSSELVCAGALQFPLVLTGGTWSYKKLPFRDGRGYFDADCSSKGIESLEVPAGRFDTVRIECKGFWTLVFDGSATGRFEETLWFAPAAKRVVRQEVRSYRSNGPLNVKDQIDLVEYRLNP